MFEVGFSEYLVIFGLALVILGPEKLPKLVASIGRWVGRARAMARNFRDQLETETESLRSDVNDVKNDFQNMVSEVEVGARNATEAVNAEVQSEVKSIEALAVEATTTEVAPAVEVPPATEVPTATEEVPAVQKPADE
jgi:sec-independent protein translocase protein TatB